MPTCCAPGCANTENSIHKRSFVIVPWQNDSLMCHYMNEF